MAMKRTTMVVMAMSALSFLVMICCHVQSVSGGEMGGFAVDNDYNRGSMDNKIVYIQPVPKTSSLSGRREQKQDSSSSGGPKSSSGHREFDSSSSGGPESNEIAIVIAFFAFFILPLTFFLTQVQKDSVLMVQVAFDGATDQIERDLDLISIVSDTRTRRGLHLMLSKTVSRVYRYPESCFSAYSNRSLIGNWRKSFDLTYHEEQKKVNALVSVNDCGEGIRRKRATCANNKYVIVTILVAASGAHELPAINSYLDLDKTLQILTSIDYESIQAVKVLWTFRDDIEDFPSLRPV